jgi:hypothetical protein
VTEKALGKQLPGKDGRREEDNIKLHTKEIGCENVKKTEMIHDYIQQYGD